MDKVIRGSQTADFTIPAGGRLPIGSQGQYVRCLAASGPFYISINGGSELFFASGIQWRADGLETYTQFDLINKSGAPVTVTIAWGFGEYTDGRLTATGNLTVVNAPASVLKVDDDESQTLLTTINTNIGDIESLLQNDRLKRTPLTTLLGATRATYNNVSPTIVSGAANVNGVIIRFLHLGSTSAVNTSFSIGGIPLIQMRGDADGGDPQVWLTDLFIQPGLSISAVLSAFSDLSICYEVL